MLTQQDAATFFDALVPYAMRRGGIAGGVIVVVKDGKILFTRGYGYADVATRKPVVPNRTLFRPGSVAKLFTWTAVMQLAGAGKLDLDTDINNYLDFKIPPKFGKPITLRNILTHTPGFEEGISEAFVNEPEELYPLRDYLIEHMPTRIFPPGEVVAYSNYGASVAGYIVQHASGELFADYVAKHILQPLGMLHSTFVQPLPRAFEKDMSKGYLTASDEKPWPFELIETAPAGALTASGTDMAAFMIAHLQGGMYNGVSILSPQMATLMHSPQSAMAPGMNGFALGFYQENRNGLRIIGHAGDTSPFHSDLHLLLDKNIGLFMSFNSLGKEGEAGTVRVELFRAFLDRYFPFTAPEEETVANPKADAARVTGWYENSRRIDSALRLLSAVGQSSVKAHPDGTIEVSALKDMSDTPKRWRQVGPLTYREVGGQTHLKFFSANGDLSWISDDFIPVDISQKVHGIKQLSALKVSMVAFIAVMAATIVTWFGGWIVRRRFRKDLVVTQRQARLRLASRIGAVMLLLMLAGWAWLFMLLSSSDASIDRPLIAVYVVGAIAAIGVLSILVEAALRIAHGPGGRLVRLGEAVLGLAALYGLWAIFEYGLANFSLHY
jgi:CubicO group peptidase (beta-lactamase class C family)